MWPDVAHGLAWSVGLFVTIMSPAQAAELIEMLFGVGPGHHLLHGVQIPHANGQF